MKKALVIVFITFIASLLLLAGYSSYSESQAKIQPVQQAQNIKLNADTIFNLVNAERTKNGLKPLIRDPRLDATAQARADDMVARNYFSHYDPVTGENLAKILNQYYPDPCSKVSENIIDSGTEAGAVKWWMRSKPHHDAILLAEYTSAGMSVNGTIGVMHFCDNK